MAYIVLLVIAATIYCIYLLDFVYLIILYCYLNKKTESVFSNVKKGRVIMSSLIRGEVGT